MPTNLIGTGLDQVPVNGMLSDLAFQNKDSIEFTDGSGKLSQFSLSAINASKDITAVDVFVYDTSKDSDGGAWRTRTQHTSWYNEELNTATRGSRREFPSVAVIVGTATTLTIYDGDDASLPMWMVFTSGGDKYLRSSPASSIAMLNGVLVVGSTSLDLFVINFISEKYKFYASTVYYNTTGDAIVNRNVVGTISTISETGLSERMVTDVAMTVLPNAPIDSLSGLPIPTIAVATAGVAHIIQNDGGVYMLMGFSPVSAITITPTRLAIYSNSGELGYVAAGTPNVYTTYNPYENWTVNRKYFGSSGGSVVRLILNSAKFGADTTDKIVTGYTAGMSSVSEDVTSPNNSMANFITSKYNTGWMPGDIKGAWLSDTTQETVSGVELVSDGGFESAANWTLIQPSATIERTTVSALTGSWGVTATSTGGSNVYSGREITGLVIGKRYHFSVNYNNLNHPTALALNTGWANGGSMILNGTGIGAQSGWQIFQVTFVATTTSVWFNVFAQGTIYLDNLSLRTAEANRAQTGNGLQVFGNVVKTPVATGADLVNYTGFSASNYLTQPYSSGLDFGTGDFSLSFWLDANYSGGFGGIHLVFNESASTLTGTAFGLLGGNTSRLDLVIGGIQHSYENIIPAGGKSSHIVAVRRSGVFYVYVDGILKITNLNVVDFTGVRTRLYIGGYWYTGVFNGFNNRISLLRISANAPSAEQIVKMYVDEKHLFQENAKATLYGSSDAVTALAYDSDTKLLHAGTSSGRSVFDGLRRIDNTTTAVVRTISAANSLVIED